MSRIAFFGTPSFSLPSLLAVVRFCRDFDHELAVVVTQQDQPQGRGQKLLPPPVKQMALDLGLLVLQPETLRKDTVEGDRFFSHFTNLNVDLAVVVAYGKIITDRLLRIPKRGFVNVHASLLPRFRGAAPIQRAIEAGDFKTGVCLMDIVKKLDEGDVYVCEKTPIVASDTSGTLFRRLSHLGAHTLYHNLSKLLVDRIAKTPQGEEGIVYASMVEKREGLINFAEAASAISRRVRAFDPSPGCYGYVRGKRIKFFDSFFITDPIIKKDLSYGTVVVAGKFLGVKALDGMVYFQKMQVEGKNALPIKEALQGFPIAVGDRIMSSIN